MANLTTGKINNNILIKQRCVLIDVLYNIQDYIKIEKSEDTKGG